MSSNSTGLSRYEAAEKWFAVAQSEHEKFRGRREASERTLLVLSILSLLYCFGVIAISKVPLTEIDFNANGIALDVILILFVCYYFARVTIDAKKQSITRIEISRCRSVLSELRSFFTADPWLKNSGLWKKADNFFAFGLGRVAALMALACLAYKAFNGMGG
jgi:hypothetical protein